MAILPGTAINNFSQLNLDWCDSSCDVSLLAIHSFSVLPNWKLTAAVFKSRPQPHSSTSFLFCSLSLWRLAVHYCCLMGSKSVTSLHFVFLSLPIYSWYSTTIAQVFIRVWPFLCCKWIWSKKKRIRRADWQIWLHLFSLVPYQTKVSEGQAVLRQLSSPSHGITYPPQYSWRLSSRFTFIPNQCIACNLLSHCHYTVAGYQV